jgi:hypothetical protein
MYLQKSGYFFKPLDNFADLLCENDQRRDNGLHRERLTLCERYFEGGVNLLVVFRDPLRPSLFPVCEFRYWPTHDGAADKGHTGEIERGSRRVQAAQVEPIDGKGGNCCGDDSVLIENIDVMEQSEIITLPSRVGFYFVDCFDDLWSGELLYLSIGNGTYKSVRRFGEWELDSIGGWRVVGTDQIPNDVVKGRMEVVSGIPSQESDGILHGFVAFDKYSAIAGYGVVPEGDTPTTSTKGVPLSFDLIDVMLGPL